MDIHVTKIEGGKRFNRWGNEVITCSAGCGRDTTMLGTKLCDPCWEERHHRDEREPRRTTQASTRGAA